MTNATGQNDHEDAESFAKYDPNKPENKYYLPSERMFAQGSWVTRDTLLKAINDTRQEGGQGGKSTIGGMMEDSEYVTKKYGPDSEYFRNQSVSTDSNLSRVEPAKRYVDRGQNT